jgi:homogentisate 1,2-dioxygenase
MGILYRNGHHDEVLFIQSGKGQFCSNFGNMNIKHGDYVVIPRGVIWQLIIHDPIRMLVVESSGPVETPNRYRNRFGQLMEDSPFCERDIRTPNFIEPKYQKNPVDVLVRIQGGYQTYSYEHHPFDLVGWDGFYFPWIFNINDFMPITGKVHLPPPIHQTFQSPGFVICSFVPRLYDYHDKAIPAPYAHSNVDSDEVLYYVKGKFMSRKGIESESITVHPMGLPHGPQPGKIEASLGKKETIELAVMIDTFSPLQYADILSTIDDSDYPYSWQES